MYGGWLRKVGIRRQRLLGAVLGAVCRAEAGQPSRERTASPLRQLMESSVYPLKASKPIPAGSWPIYNGCLGPRWLLGWESLNFKNLEEVWTADSIGRQKYKIWDIPLILPLSGPCIAFNKPISSQHIYWTLEIQWWTNRNDFDPYKTFSVIGEICIKQLISQITV